MSAGPDVLRARLRRDDAGFTLVELLVSLLILGIIAVPLAGMVIGFLKNSDATAARLSESHDAQLATAYFAQDVQAIGVRDYSATGSAYVPLLRSVETDVAPGAGDHPCGPAGTPDAVVRFAWDDFGSGTSPSFTQTRVAYVVQGAELHRLLCAGSPSLTSDVVVAHNLVAPSAAVSCADRSGAPIACTASGSAVPSSVSLTLTIRDPQNRAGTDYTVTLTGQRRQS